jgi:predicted anti-sigma-YlaC factor YlaD
MSGWAALALIAAATTATTGCSIKRMAVNSIANSLTAGGDVFTSDDDPELIRDALPFGLKTIESLLAIVPDHQGLLLSACQGYTQYAFAFVQTDADRLETADYEGATVLRERALKLYLRARGFGLRGLEHKYRGVGEQLKTQPKAAAARIRRRELPLLYWTAAAWGSAISLGKDRPELVADVDAVRALMARGLELDESFDSGAFHEALVVLESLPAMMGGSVERARTHFQRAVELSKGGTPGPYVTMASSVSVTTQNRPEFEQLLGQALAIDPDREPSRRLATLIMQRRARELLRRADELFLDADTSTAGD